MVSEQFDPAMGTRSKSSIKVDQQSMLEIKEINRSISDSLKQMLIDLRSVISEINSRNKKIEFVEEELQIVKKELSGDLDEDMDDKQLQREGTIDQQPDPETKLIWKSDPNPSSYPYSDPNPETTLNSSSDQKSDLNFEFGNSRNEEAIEEVHVDDEYDNQKRNSMKEIVGEKSASRTMITCSRDESRILKFGAPMAPFSGNCNAEIESVSCVFSLHPNPDINPDPPDVYLKPFHNSWPMSLFSLTSSILFGAGKAMNERAMEDEHSNGEGDDERKVEKRIEFTVGEPPPWSLPAPSLFDCSIFGKRRQGTSDNMQGSSKQVDGNPRVYVEAVQGGQVVSLNSIVGLSTLERMKLEGVKGQKIVVLIDSGKNKRCIGKINDAKPLESGLELQLGRFFGQILIFIVWLKGNSKVGNHWKLIGIIWVLHIEINKELRIWRSMDLWSGKNAAAGVDESDLPSSLEMGVWQSTTLAKAWRVSDAIKRKRQVRCRWRKLVTKRGWLEDAHQEPPPPPLPPPRLEVFDIKSLIQLLYFFPP